MHVSSLVEEQAPETLVRWPKAAVGAFWIVLLSVVGLFSIARPILHLWTVWTTDPLRSIGMFFPFISLALILREASRMGWRMTGSWWGLLPLVLAIVAAHLRDSMMLVFEVSHTLFFLPHDGPVVFLYGCGVVLLFGGRDLFRRCLFPLALLLCLNPVPHFFNAFVDVPLQYMSAHIARSFALALGHPLTPGQLRLMFTPEFGLYIAPGCNGIRGSITMGYFALIAGFLLRLPVRMHALIVAGAVLLGYLFNFLRLCLLVVFYVMALHVPSWQNHGKNVDYAIGSCLFVIATILFSSLLLNASRRAQNRRALAKDGKTDLSPAPLQSAAGRALTMRSVSLKLAVFAALIVFGSVSYARTVLQGGSFTMAQSAPIRLADLYPARLGNFTLVRTWKDGAVNDLNEDYDWAEYRGGANGELITIGISPLKGAHDAIFCHLARGERPVWRGTSHLLTSDGQDVAFSSFFYSDGVSQLVEASTLCGPDHCGEISTLSSPIKMLFSAPLTGSMVDEALGRPIPVLIKAETTDLTIAPELAKEQLLGELHEFVSGASLASLSGNYFPHTK